MISMTLAETSALLNGELQGSDARYHAVSTDSRRLEPRQLFVALAGPTFDGHAFVSAAQRRGACGALVSQAVATDLPLVRVSDTRRALGCLGAAWRERFTGLLIALTGSNGKTTVKEMLSSILRCRGRVLATQGNLNNEIGMPLTLLRLQEDDYAIIEMGANHSGEIAYLSGLARPDVAIVNNAGPAHLEGFGNLEGVAKAKGEIFQGLGQNGVAVVNRDDPYADYWCSLNHGRQVLDFGLDHPAAAQGRILDPTRNRFRLMTGSREIDVSLPLPGVHNVRNALAAAAASLAVGATLEEIREGLERMSPVAGRLQILPGRSGSTIINDTYNANPASLSAALDAVSVDSGVKWLVLGDMAELGTGTEALHEQAGRQARAAGFRCLYTVGHWSRRAALAFGPGGEHFASMELLIEALTAIIDKTGDKPVILIKGSRSMRMERIVQPLVAEPHAPDQKEAHLPC